MNFGLIPKEKKGNKISSALNGENNPKAENQELCSFDLALQHNLQCTDRINRCATQHIHCSHNGSRAISKLTTT